MPLNACGWSTEEDERLAELVQPHSYLYNVQDPSRKNILARGVGWLEIAETLSKPVEECKKRWRGLRDCYMRSKRLGTSMHKTKAGVFEKLQFLDASSMEADDDPIILKQESKTAEEDEEHEPETNTEQQVITDSQEYYEITVVEPNQVPASKHLTNHQKFIKILPKTSNMVPASEQVQKKIRKVSRKKAIPVTLGSMAPVKILPKPVGPMHMNGPKLIQYIEDQKTPEQRSQAIDKLIERVLKENTNEIDVFFRSMAASVKKLQPNLIPKVKMEVCSIIAKYEMQSIEKSEHQ